MKILACLDGSKNTKDALEFIGVLGRKPGTDVTLLHVRRCDLCNVFPVIKDSILKRREMASSRLLYEGQKILEGYGIKAKTKARAGDVLGEILDEAAKGDYDLVVIGSQGVKGIEMFFFGALSYRLIERLNTPVLVVRKGKKSLTKILACTDGSEHAKKALIYATGLARAANARLSLLHVAKPSSAASEYKNVVDDGKALLKEKGLEAETLVLRGKTSKKILDTARKGNYDLIVLGKTGISPMKMLFSGSVVYDVLKGAKVPCLIVK